MKHALFLFLWLWLYIPGLQFTFMPNIQDLKLNKCANAQMIPFIKSCPKQACLVYNYAR